MSQIKTYILTMGESVLSAKQAAAATTSPWLQVTV